MIAYLIISALAFQCLGVMWTRRNIPNTVFKCFLLTLSLWGWIMTLLKMGSMLQNNPIY